MASWTKNQVVAADQWLKQQVNSARGGYGRHFAWYQQNAGRLSSADRSRIGALLGQEGATLQPLEQLLFTFEQRARQFGFLSGLSGLGDWGDVAVSFLLAGPIGAVIAYLTGLSVTQIGSWVGDNIRMYNATQLAFAEAARLNAATAAKKAGVPDQALLPPPGGGGAGLGTGLAVGTVGTVVLVGLFGLGAVWVLTR